MTRTVLPLRLVWLAALVLLAGCRGDDRLPVELPAPCFAVDGPIYDSLGKRALDAQYDIFMAIPSKYTVTEAYITHSVRVDSSVTWEQIEGFYANEFTYSPLTNSGFDAVPVVSPDTSRYEFLLWARPGRRTGLRAPPDEVLLVYYMRPPGSSRYGVLQWTHLFDERVDGYRYGERVDSKTYERYRYSNFING